MLQALNVTKPGHTRHERKEWRAQRPHTLIAAILALTALVGTAGCAASSTPGAAAGAPSPTVPHALATSTPGPGTPTATAQERLFASTVTQAIGSLAQDMLVTYDAGHQSVTVAVTVGGIVPNTDAAIGAAQEQVKTICFRAQHALWTSGTAFRQVTITVTGPILDQYADLTTGAYGAAVLTAATVGNFAWASLTPDLAWGKYDNVFLRPAYNDAS